MLRRDLEALLESHSVPGVLRACAMEGMTRSGACYWEAQARDVDALARAFVLVERGPSDQGGRWQGLSRCRRLSWDIRNRAYGAFDLPPQRLPSKQSFASLVAFVPAEGGEACLQAVYKEK